MVDHVTEALIGHQGGQASLLHSGLLQLHP